MPAAARAGVVFTCLFTVSLVFVLHEILAAGLHANVKLYGESTKDASRNDFYQNWAVFRNEQLAMKWR